MNIKDRMIMDEYSDNKENYTKIGESVHIQLKELVDNSGIVVMGIEHQLKTEKCLESLLYKNSDEYQKLADITNVLVVKVICYFKDEVQAVGELIKQNYETSKSDDNVYVCKSAEELYFEIHVKTVLEHTWQTINNDLGYSEYGIPSAVTKEFSRLAGLLEIADDEFVRVRDDMKLHSEIARQKIMNDEADDVVVDSVSLNEYMLHNAKMRSFLEELAAIEGSEISDVNAQSYIAQLRWLRINTIGDLQKALERDRIMAVELASRVLKGSELDILSSNVALRFLCRAELINAGYSEEDVVKFIELSVNKRDRAEREAKRLFKMCGNIREGK